MRTYKFAINLISQPALFVCLFVNAVGWCPPPRSFPASLSSIGNYARWGCRDPLCGPAGTLWVALHAKSCTRQGDLTYSNARSGVLIGNESRAWPYLVPRATDNRHAYHLVHRYPQCHASGSLDSDPLSYHLLIILSPFQGSLSQSK